MEGGGMCVEGGGRCVGGSTCGIGEVRVCVGGRWEFFFGVVCAWQWNCPKLGLPMVLIIHT